ncbi:hypothetical protein EG329_012051 [Mollisiaceae sp. DMI_Dod_QoI]|nr:hypothetical protein EG329_012051 [Helotiales sp. DMI_Dod_QoI]
MPQTFLITSATGAQGGATARELLYHGAKVHALVRDLSSPASKALQSLGVTLFEGTFFDLPAIKEALVGVTGVFLNTFPSFTDPDGEVQQARNIVTAAKEAKSVTTIVVSTVYKASERAEIAASKPNFPFLNYYLARKAGVEEVVKAAGFEHWTVLRPDWLDYNYLAPGCVIHFPEYQSEHVLTVSYDPSFKKSHLDPYDVGKFAAAALLEPQRYDRLILELSGELLTFEEIAERLSRASGVRVTVRFRTEEETRELVESNKIPVIELQIWEREVKFENDRKALDKYGIQLGTLEEYLKREKGRLLETLGVSPK